MGSVCNPSSSSSYSCSSSSAEFSFRELDDVFLQSQTRIWLGEVLQTRLSEEQSICDLLSDGELLFEVSKVLWSMLLMKHMELRHVKAHTSVAVAAKKSSGRYTPYSNVDSFLKICKVLGLSGVDLFSPSDVVEKRDTRKVCICIRSLSKKARAEQLDVPDFDMVTNTTSMPSEIVGCIRRSLELSTCSYSNGNYNDPRMTFRQKYSVTVRERRNELLFEESDEAESNFLETQSYSSYEDTPHIDYLYLDPEESPEVNSKIQRYTLPEGVLEPDIHDQETDRYKRQYNSVHISASPVVDTFGTNSSHYPILLAEDCLYQSSIGTESNTSNSVGKPSKNGYWRSFLDTDNNVEWSPASSMSSVVGRVLNFDSEGLKTSISITDLYNYDVGSMDEGLVRYYEPWDTTRCKESLCGSIYHAEESQLGKELECSEVSAESIVLNGDDWKTYALAYQDPHSPADRDLGDSSGVKGIITGVVDDGKELGIENEDGDEYEKKDNIDDCPVEVKDEVGAEIPKKQHSHIGSLLKTIAKGTALLGVLFLLHLRNRREEDKDQEAGKQPTQIPKYLNSGNRSEEDKDKETGKKPMQILKTHGVQFSSLKEDKGSKIYPAEKFKFK